MQQPGLQQIPTGWPGMPGLQAPLSAQDSPYGLTGQTTPFSLGQSPFQTPGPSPFPSPATDAYTVYPQTYPHLQSTYPATGMATPPPRQQANPLQFQGQGQYQAPAPSQVATQPQAQGVAPVSFPSSPYGSPQPQAQQAQPNPAQLIAQQLVEMAKALEQLVPGYQTLISLLHELNSASTAGLGDAVRTAEECLYYHGAALGAIRRLLCGEATPAVLINLATAFHRLSQVQPRMLPVVDRVLSLLPSTQQGPVSSLLQTLSTAEGQLNQVSTSIQGFVGPQIWESARRQVQPAAPTKPATAKP